MPFELETDRLLLRDLRRSDRARLLEQVSDPTVQSFILRGQGSEAAVRWQVEASERVARHSPRVHYLLAVVSRDDGTVLGSCSLRHAARGSSASRVGWHIGRSHWGLGYATEAARALLRLAFEDRRVRRVTADCF